MKKTFSLVLKILGAIFILVGLLCGWASLNAFLERSQHGAGLMFADVEILFFLTVVFSLVGFLCFRVAKKLKA